MNVHKGIIAGDAYAESCKLLLRILNGQLTDHKRSCPIHIFLQEEKQNAVRGAMNLSAYKAHAYTCTCALTSNTC